VGVPPHPQNWLHRAGPGLCSRAAGARGCCPAGFGAQGARQHPGVVPSSTLPPAARGAITLLLPGSPRPLARGPQGAGGWQRGARPCWARNYGRSGALACETRVRWGAGEADASVCRAGVCPGPAPPGMDAGNPDLEPPLALVPSVLDSPCVGGPSCVVSRGVQRGSSQPGVAGAEFPGGGFQTSPLLPLPLLGA